MTSTSQLRRSEGVASDVTILGEDVNMKEESSSRKGREELRCCCFFFVFFCKEFIVSLKLHTTKPFIQWICYSSMIVVGLHAGLQLLNGLKNAYVKFI